MAQAPSVPPAAAATLRDLLAYTDDEIVQALRGWTTSSEMARLHDIIGTRVFDLLVNIPPDPTLTATADAPGPSQGPCPSDGDGGPPTHGTGTQFLGVGDGDGGACAPPAPSVPDGSASQRWTRPSDGFGGGDPSWFEVGLSPRSRLNPPWSSRDGWAVRVRLPQAPCHIDRPSDWPYPRLFCLHYYDVPTWVELQPPPQGVNHLEIKGYCTEVCSVCTPVRNCVGLCLRPIMKDARTGHEHHRCYACLKGGAY